jgi:hypothetical protein
MSRISERNLTTIREFAKERNRLFGGNVFTSPHPRGNIGRYKTRLIEPAKIASQIAFIRAFGVWSDEEKGGIGNKNTPRPNKPEALGTTVIIQNAPPAIRS